MTETVKWFPFSAELHIGGAVSLQRIQSDKTGPMFLVARLVKALVQTSSCLLTILSHRHAASLPGRQDGSTRGAVVGYAG